MNTIRKALIPLFLLPALTAVQAEAVSPPAACTDAVESMTRSQAQHRVNQSSRPGQDNGQARTFWINSHSGERQVAQNFKSKCVTNPEGKVVSLRVEQGYWK